MRHGDGAPPDEDALGGAVSPCPWFIAERPALEALRARLQAALTQFGVHGDESGLIPPLDAELARFFDDALAPAVQQRETALMNDLYDCFQRELEARTANERARRIQLHERDQECAQLRAQLDRRVADTNALRKEYYKQLLMLRDMVNKQKNDPKTLSALNDAIASANSSGREGANAEAARSGDPMGADRNPRQLQTLDTSYQRSDSVMSPSMRREREKWEQRAHEASVECQQLRDQVALLRQQAESLRQNESNMWFLDSRNGVSERQRIIDAVYKAKCNWEDVGGSVVELLNNEVIWEAVERAVRIKTVHAPRGLEALITELDTRHASATDMNRRNSSGPDDGAPELGNMGAAQLLTRLSSDGVDRLIPCRACNGAGYISSKGGADDDDSDSYLRRTLAQVLELKASLDQANAHSNEIEQELQTTLTCYAQLQGKMEQIEASKRLRVEMAVQADLDDEDEEQALAAITDNDGQSTNWASTITRKSKRVQLFERLITELKRSLIDKDAGIKELRAAVESSQTRLVVLQKQYHQEQQAFKREISALKTALALSMKHRNTNIDEKQAAVKFLLKRLASEHRQMSLRRRSTASLIKEERELEDTNDGGGSGNKRPVDQDDDDFGDLSSDGNSSDEEHEIERSEKVARRYSEAIDRVQKEFQEHQARMSEIDEEIKDQDDKRKRTNSIALGNIVVTMSSHPRDLFKALATAQGELSKLRRASQQSSTLQADRLLTLTTHLSHISEELCMVRKRTNAENEFWRLECEKLQNTNSALITEQQGYQQRLAEMQGQLASASFGAATAAQSCYMCAKHQERLADISNWMLANEPESVCPTGQQDAEITSNSASLLTPTTENVSSSLAEHDQRAVNGLVLEIEQVCATMSSATQEVALTLLGRAIFGNTALPLPRVQGAGAYGSLPGISGPGTPQGKRHASVLSGAPGSRDAVPGSAQSLELQSPARSRSAPSYREVSPESRRATTNALQPYVESTDDHAASSLGNNSDGVSTAYPGSRPGIGGLLAVRGRAVSTVSYPSADSSSRSLPEKGVRMLSQLSAEADYLPSFRRKKTVKKLLSHQELEHWRRKCRPYDIQVSETQDPTAAREPGKPDDEGDPSPESARDADSVPYSVYSDDKGEDVYCVDVEISDEDDDDDGDVISPRDDALPLVMPIIIPRVVSVGDKRLHRGSSVPTRSTAANNENQQLHDAAANPIKAAEQPMHNGGTRFANDKEDDPPIIQQLRALLKLNSAARERLVAANWECLVSLTRLATSQSRLATFGVEARVREGTPSSIASSSRNSAKIQLSRMREALETAVRLRERVVEEALAARHDAKRECRKLQSHFMHSIATMMTILSQRSKRGNASTANTAFLGGRYDMAPASPSGRVGWGYYSRPLYPATQVNLGRLPPTQQLSTPSFPIGFEPGSTPPRMSQSPSARLTSKSEIRDIMTDQDACTSIDPPSSDLGTHAAFPHRVIKFVSPSSLYDFSLTQSASILFKSPSQSSDAISRTLSKTALPPASLSSYPTGSPAKSQTVRLPERPESASAAMIASPHRNPTRPQSSPSPTSRIASPRQR